MSVVLLSSNIDSINTRTLLELSKLILDKDISTSTKDKKYPLVLLTKMKDGSSLTDSLKHAVMSFLIVESIETCIEVLTWPNINATAFETIRQDQYMLILTASLETWRDTVVNYPSRTSNTICDLIEKEGLQTIFQGYTKQSTKTGYELKCYK